ncbi:MAG: AAA family ATPase [Candidatus Thiosymbion ectosymbiont of Robbea hypermnestra]|nr:AAA family ATPase [Candidatus Thiosymbion ectosymbiont of Robbea hypermnestra]
MQTLVFHSIKGGVGRSLALCNLARALAATGKRVLMLDFDYSAPGLHHKWKRPSGPGYLEYLATFGVEDRVGNISERERWHRLRDRIEPIDEHLYLLRAGDETSPDYWRLISSYRFHRLFYFARKEVNGLNRRVFPLEWLDLNRQAFDADKQLIETHLAPDYLLVDCKTSIESSAFILLSWADAIAHFLPANPEGIQYACGTAQAIVRQMAWRGASIGFIPVIARVSDHHGERTDQDCIRAIGETWSRRHWAGEEQDYAARLFRERDFVSLTETREIEGRERILLETQGEKDHLWQLSHDYLDLCARLVPPEEYPDDPTAAKTWWYEQLNMDPDARILAKQFDRYPHLGILLNIDEQPHIAMRVKTFHLLIEELLNACQPGGSQARQNALVAAGRRCGRDFAAELNDIFERGGIETSLPKRIGAWAEFDSGVGIGAIHPLKITETTPPEIWLLVVGDVFGLHPDRPSDNQGKDLRHFFESYLEGVIGGILQAVTAQDSLPRLHIQTTTEDTLPEPILAAAKGHTGHAGNKGPISYYRITAAPDNPPQT